MPLYVSSTMCSSSGSQIVLYSIWYCHTCPVHRLREDSGVFSHPVHRTATYRCDDTRYCIIQFEHLMMSTTVLKTCTGI